MPTPALSSATLPHPPPTPAPSARSGVASTPSSAASAPLRGERRQARVEPVRGARLYLLEIRDSQSKAPGVSYEKKKRKRSTQLQQQPPQLPPPSRGSQLSRDPGIFATSKKHELLIKVLSKTDPPSSTWCKDGMTAPTKLTMLKSTRCRSEN
ncbi:hypothetical protein RJ640_012278 [Escallonia rubra]|uniref:Uncharacterized protein n=1 Tax=Escallonia rubra TaxID=112253 RepID=A0AA88QVG9_9ASTE|nr:hypothetical protein RJ640_012278 [Escallonia rubra]